MTNHAESVGLQEHYAPASECFGCGPANVKGLRIRSIPDETSDSGVKVRARWKPESHHEAFPGMLNGGIIGSLLDCHSNWTAAWLLMRARGETHPPCTVTSEFNVKLLRPTPTDGEVELVAWVESAESDRAWILAELWAKGKKCATCRGLFVAVKEGHPAFHRW